MRSVICILRVMFYCKQAQSLFSLKIRNWVFGFRLCQLDGQLFDCYKNPNLCSFIPSIRVQWVTPVCSSQNTTNHRMFVTNNVTWHDPVMYHRVGVFSVMVTLAFTSRITAWIAITGNYCSLAERRLAGSPSHQISMSILLFKLAPRLYQVAQSVNESNLSLIVQLWLWTWSNIHI